MLSVVTEPDEKDATDYKFWCNHHRESAKWLAIRVQQLLVDGDELIKPILLAVLPEFLKEYAHSSKYHFSETPRDIDEN